MTDVTITDGKIVPIFEPAKGGFQTQRMFRVGSGTVRVAWSQAALEAGGGITMTTNDSRLIVGHNQHVGAPLFAKAIDGDAVVERDEN